MRQDGVSNDAKNTNHQHLAVTFILALSVMAALVPSSNVGARTQQADIALQTIDQEPGTPFVLVTDTSWAWETDNTSGDNADEISFPGWTTVPDATWIWAPSCHGEHDLTPKN